MSRYKGILVENPPKGRFQTVDPDKMPQNVASDQALLPFY